MSPAAAPRDLGGALGGVEEDIQNHICPSRSDRRLYLIQLVMSVAWRAYSFLSSNRESGALRGKSPSQSQPGLQPGLGASRSGPCHSQATAAKATFKEESEGAGKTPPHPYKGVPPSQGCWLYLESLWGNEHLGLKVSIPTGSLLPWLTHLRKCTSSQGLVLRRL